MFAQQQLKALRRPACTGHIAEPTEAGMAEQTDGATAAKREGRGGKSQFKAPDMRHVCMRPDVRIGIARHQLLVLQAMTKLVSNNKIPKVSVVPELSLDIFGGYFQTYFQTLFIASWSCSEKSQNSIQKFRNL